MFTAAIFFSAASAKPMAADEYRYRLRDSSRMEGLKDVPTASQDLRIVSFLSYREDFKLSAGSHLKLKFYVPSDDPVFIMASEIVPLRHYFMEPVQAHWPVGWQEFSQWPANSVLIPKEIHPAKLGVVARLNSNKSGSGHLVPVLFYVTSPPAKVSSYKLRVVSRETLSSVSYGLKRHQGSQLLLQNTFQKKYFPAGIPITLRLDLTGELAGWFKLWIGARVKNQIDGPRRTYFFFHQPSAGL